MKSGVERSRWFRHGDAVAAGCLLAIASVGKVADLGGFAFSLANIFPLSKEQAWPVAGLILVLETVLAISLISRGEDRWVRRYGATLFLAFVIVHAVIHVTRSRAMDCGCFGVLQGRAVTAFMGTPIKALCLNLAFALVLLRLDLVDVVRGGCRRLSPRHKARGSA